VYLLDTPHGKVPLARSRVRGRDGDFVVVEAWDGALWRERNPLDEPSDVLPLPSADPTPVRS
jgi:lysine 2,3-aminomutase